MVSSSRCSLWYCLVYTHNSRSSLKHVLATFISHSGYLNFEVVSITKRVWEQRPAPVNSPLPVSASHFVRYCCLPDKLLFILCRRIERLGSYCLQFIRLAVGLNTACYTWRWLVLSVLRKVLRSVVRSPVTKYSTAGETRCKLIAKRT